MTRRAGKAALAAAALLGLLALIRIVEIRVPVAAYEADYLKNDPPAYHLTPVKRLVRQLSERDGTLLSIIYQRRIIAVFRLLALLALLGLSVLHLGRKVGAWAFAVFLSLPPTFVYFIRVDPWMDSVCFTIFSLYCLTPGRYPLLNAVLAGIFSSLAVDSKLTVCLTLIPAVWMFLRSRSGKEKCIFSAGVLAGFSAAQPDWFMHPSHALAHAGYWRSVNAALPALSPVYPITALFSVIPFSIWCLAGVGLLETRRNNSIRASAALIAIPVIFFMAYRTVNPDGVRHLYMIFPFLAAAAAVGLNRLNPIQMSVLGMVWIGETVWRNFSV